MRFQNSLILKQRAENSIAHGSLTNSKRPESFVLGAYPTHLNRSFRAYTWDVDGNKYIDFICSLGANLVGACNKKIESAVIDQLSKGTIYSLNSALEIEYAERLQGLFPNMERIRFLKTGSEACSAALRIARAYTGKDTVLSEGYHGWHDEFTSLTKPAKGVPELLWRIEHLKSGAMGTQIAAVIIEPIMTDISEQRLENLRRIRKFCDQTEALLIYDETITGFRFPGYSAAKWTGVEPDITILGKAMGGGFPLSAVGGRKAVMESDYFVSSTFAGDQVALRAGLALLDVLNNEFPIERMWAEAESFQKQFNEIAPFSLRIDGYPTRGAFTGDPLVRALFFQEAIKGGMLFGPSFFWNACHNEEIYNVLSLSKSILGRILKNEVQLEGELPKSAYAQKVRNQ